MSYKHLSIVEGENLPSKAQARYRRRRKKCHPHKSPLASSSKVTRRYIGQYTRQNHDKSQAVGATRFQLGIGNWELGMVCEFNFPFPIPHSQLTVALDLTIHACKVVVSD